MILNWKKEEKKTTPTAHCIYYLYLNFIDDIWFLWVNLNISLFSYGSFAFYIVVWVWKTALRMYHVKRPLPGFRNPRECPVKEHRYLTVHPNFLFNLTKDHFHFLNLCLIWRERIQSKFSFTALIKNRNHFEVLFIQSSE